MDTLERIKSLSEVGYTQFSDAEITATGDGWAEGKMRITEHHLNPYGAVHGGAMFCLGDVVGGVAVWTKGSIPVTLNSDITYFKPITGSSEIYARADVIKYGKSTAYVEVRILSEQNKECARITANYFNIQDRIDS